MSEQQTLYTMSTPTIPVSLTPEPHPASLEIILIEAQIKSVSGQIAALQSYLGALRKAERQLRGE